MKKIIIDNFGPIHHCELETKDFMIFMGPQASGKSTIAKTIFFFKNIGNLLIQDIHKRELYNILEFEEEKEYRLFSENRLIKILQLNFQQIFGDISYMNRNMKLVAYYSENSYITISVLRNKKERYLDIQLSQEVIDFIEMQNETNIEYEKKIKQSLEKAREAEKKGEDSLFASFKHSILKSLKKSLVDENINEFFSDGREVVYIPAGRSMMTLLSTQWDYLYATMDDRQKRNIDYCTQNYLERILKLKSSFKESLESQIEDNIDGDYDVKLLNLAKDMIKNILQGEYKYVNGEERLQISDRRSVKINFASSGQQEALWILNILFDSLVSNRKSLFIIEEPESNLFPDAQKLIMEFIALAQNNGQNQILITTHSPYILGTINNLLYAKNIEDKVDSEKLRNIISKYKRIDFKKLSAFFMRNNKIEDCTDKEDCSIKNEVIDSASDYINGDFESMLDLMEECQKGDELCS